MPVFYKRCFTRTNSFAKYMLLSVFFPTRRCLFRRSSFCGRNRKELTLITNISSPSNCDFKKAGAAPLVFCLFNDPFSLFYSFSSDILTLKIHLISGMTIWSQPQHSAWHQYFHSFECSSLFVCSRNISL